MSASFPRRPRSWNSPHDRARVRTSERLDAPLDADEAAWLDAHLADCGGCRAVAAAYEAQRLELRTLRDQGPVPPRDLWARTAAAIEREAAGSAAPARSRGSRVPLLRRVRPSPIPLGALSGVLVVAVVVGASLLGGRPSPAIAPTASAVVALHSQAPSTAPRLTPIPVTADLGWMRVGPQGQMSVYFSTVDEVCASSAARDCAPIEEATPRNVTLPEPPRSVVLSPTASQLVVVEANTSSGTGGTVYVVPVPTPPGGAASPTPVPPPTPIPTHTGDTATSAPGTPPPTPTPHVTVGATIEPQVPPPSPTGSAVSPTVPTGSAGSPTPHDTPTPATPSPASPTPPGQREIASNVVVVGETAAYSPDGTWFAFSARPAQGGEGPDIYIWRSGDARAEPITTDHRSVFSGWLDDQILGSRAVFEPRLDGAGESAAGGFAGRSFVIDPNTRTETPLDGVPGWRPTVDPTRRLAIYWDGSLEFDQATSEWRPSTGRLVIGRWPGATTPSPSDDATSEPGTARPSAPASARTTPSASSSVAPSVLPDILQGGAVRDWEARWDETGTRLAVWIADDSDPSFGRLSLYVVDPATGRITADPPLAGELALPGYSIGDGRLVWATPPRQNGQGSRVKVLAWTGTSFGSVETAPGNEQAVVIR